MSQDQVRVVLQVYRHLMNNEKRGWDALDDYLDHLEYLDDNQLHRECDVILERHTRGTIRCEQDHARERCFMPLLVEAVSAILELYKNTNEMHKKNKYILQYYLAMNHAGMIIVEGV